MKYATILKLVTNLPIYQKITASLSAVALAVMIYSLVSLFRGAESSESVSNAPMASSSLGHLTIDVTGAVAQPGIYTLSTGDRVAQAIEAAGGLSAEADQSQLNGSFNLAEALTDGEKLEIPAVQSGGDNAADQNIDAPSSSPNLVSLNRASLEELDALPGIGAARAQAIIEHRPYTTIDEVVSKGILGPAVWEKLKDKVSY